MKISAGLLALLAVATAVRGRAQEPAAALVLDLPDSPSALQQGPAVLAEVGTAHIAGVIVDVQGDPVPGAKVTLTARGRFDPRMATTGADGSYSFSDLPAFSFRVSAAAPGFVPAVSTEFAVRAAETVTAPRLTLAVASTSSSVDVVATPDQVASEEVREQEHQRVLGVFPNFYTSYIWKASPMPTKLKYKLAVRSLVDPFTFLIVAGTAGAEHYNGTYPGYGPGIAGYGKRFGAAYGDALTARLIGSAILPEVLHQDPRYFYQGSGSVASRSTHAVASTFFTRGDNGRIEINYSHLLGSLAAGAIANAYHPASSRGVGLTFETFGITTGSNMVGNLIREFVFRKLEPSVPVFANGRKTP